jgi:hypothetical protein
LILSWVVNISPVGCDLVVAGAPLGGVRH